MAEAAGAAGGAASGAAAGSVFGPVGTAVGGLLGAFSGGGGLGGGGGVNTGPAAGGNINSGGLNVPAYPFAGGGPAGVSFDAAGGSSFTSQVLIGTAVAAVVGLLLVVVKKVSKNGR